MAKSDPELALEALAKSLQAASQDSLTFHQAYDRAVMSSEGRALYRAYRQAAMS